MCVWPQYETPSLTGPIASYRERCCIFKVAMVCSLKVIYVNCKTGKKKKFGIYNRCFCALLFSSANGALCVVTVRRDDS